MADGTIKFDLKILDEKAKKRLSELDETIKKSGKNVDEELANKAYDFSNKWKEAEREYASIMQKMKSNTEMLKEAQSFKDIASKRLESGKGGAETQLVYDKAVQDIENINAEQSKLTLQAEKQVLIQDRLGLQAKSLTEEMKKKPPLMERLGKETKKVSRSSKSLTSSFAGSAKSLFKVSLAMLGIRGVMTGLTKITNEWYNSNNAGARQAQANMQAMTNGIVNLLAPALTFITGLMAQIMGYINAIAKAFFGVNLLSKNTSKNIGTGTKNAKELNKEIKGFRAGFDEADVASSNFTDNLDGGGAGGGGGAVDLEPNIVTPDLSDFKKRLEKAFAPMIATLKSIDLKPLQKAFEQLGNSIVNILGIIGQSFANIMNYSIAPFIKIMAEEIVPRFLILFAEALDMLAPYLQWFLTELVEPFIQWLLLDFAPVGFETLARAFELLIVVVEAFLKAMQNVWKDVEPTAKWMGGVFKDMVEGLGDAFAELTDEINEDDSGLVSLFETIIKVVGVILLIKGVIGVFTGVVGVLTTAVGFLTKMFTPLWSIIKVVAGFFAGAFSGSLVAIIALVLALGTMLVGLATNFEQVKEDFFRIIGNITGAFGGLLEFLGGVFSGDWKRIWKGLVQMFSNIIGGIANIFKFPINLMIDGLNAFIRGLNRIKIPNWVPGVGGKGINIGSIPRLASGATLTHQTVAMMAEYPNARTNPEIVSPEKKMRQVFEESIAKQGGGQLGGVRTIRIEMPVYLSGKQITKEVQEISLEEMLQNNGGGDFGWNM